MGQEAGRLHGDCCLWAIAHRHAQQLQGTKLSCLLRCLLVRHLGDREGQRTGCFQLQYVFCWGGRGGGRLLQVETFYTLSSQVLSTLLSQRRSPESRKLQKTNKVPPPKNTEIATATHSPGIVSCIQDSVASLQYGPHHVSHPRVSSPPSSFSETHSNQDILARLVNSPAN
jgi:hypothetical protein